MPAFLTRSKCWVVLILCVLECMNFLPANAEKVWKCSGKPTTYTFTDCETDKSLTDGCYYLVHFEQYRPCNDICDGVEMWSIDEERCRSYCPAYISKFCIIQTQEQTTREMRKQSGKPSKKMRRTTIGRITTTQAHKLYKGPIIMIFLAVAAIFSLLLLTFIIVFLARQRKSRRHLNKRRFSTPNQSTDYKFHLDPLKPESPLDVLVCPKEASTDNESNKKKEFKALGESSVNMVD